MKYTYEKEVLEDISNLCHVEWMNWSKNISNELNETVELLNKNNEYLKEENSNIKKKNELIKANTLLTDKFTEKVKLWKSFWIPYEELTEDIKEKDRVYARKILELIE